MKLLELFSGTKSVGKVAEQLGYEVISLDLKDADINCNILDWDYTTCPVGYFDVIWGSPPCDTFSVLRLSNVGRHGFTKEKIQDDIDNIGVPILRRTEEIINYFKPQYYFIENPQTGRMKEYINKPYYDVDYCKYADLGYRKRTRIWTNLTGFIPKVCKKDCNSMDGAKHSKNISRATEAHINRQSVRHRIPPALIEELFNCMDLDLQ